VTRRFFVEPPLDGSAEVRISGPLARRLATVLRMQSGDEVVLFDGSGEDVRVRLDQVHQRAVEGSVVERSESPAESHVRVHLYQSITKGERFEWLIEKATELGAARVVPLIAARSVVRTGGDASKRDRWRRIAVEAAEQCGRALPPAIEAPQRFDDAIASAPGVLVLP
jgi:16S rRNA (uracil1498-N3)-methyltransferase